MKMIKKYLVSMSLLVFLLSMASVVQAGKYVKWHSDGNVDLIMEDGTVIPTSREELGGLFGPSEKPFKGATITITAVSYTHLTLPTTPYV